LLSDFKNSGDQITSRQKTALESVCLPLFTITFQRMGDLYPSMHLISSSRVRDDLMEVARETAKNAIKFFPETLKEEESKLIDPSFGTSVEDMLIRIKLILDLNGHSYGFYPSVGYLNHSCDANCK
jgi:hypothetical protein